MQVQMGASTLLIKVQLKRCGMAVRLIVKSSEYNNKRKPDPKLITRMLNAYDWFERLTSGKADSIQSIAKEERVSSSYVTRVVHLAFLAPEFVKRIATGDNPPEFNVDCLIRKVPLSNDWDVQHQLLGFPIL